MLATTVTGLPAVIIILVVLALIVAGIVALVRASARGVKRVASKDEDTQP